MADLSNIELSNQIKILETKLDENAAIINKLLQLLYDNTEYSKKLLELLEKNNIQTKDIHDYITVELSTEQQLKDFGLNIAANLLGNTVSVPTIINLKNR